MVKPKRNLVVKDNALIESSYKLELIEQRLVLLAIMEARAQELPIKGGQMLRIHSNAYIEHFGVKRHTAYESMRKASKGLFEASFKWFGLDENENFVTYESRWVQKIAYSKSSGYVSLVLSDEVIPLITELEKNFTSYEIEQVRNLDSNYAIRLYELLIKWRGVGKTPKISLEDLRRKLGIAEKSYSTMSNFKKNVLDLAKDQINEHTDITLSYEAYREGRSIAGFEFNFDHKALPKKPKDFVNPVTLIESKKTYNSMTMTQIEDYSNRLSLQSDQMELWGEHGGQSKLKTRITHELMTIEGYQRWLPQLKALGHRE
jgi:plasmid replication initiation protein